jgi:opine dehydrogenase
MAGHLAMMGFSVNVWNRGPDRVEHLRMRGSIELEGALSGEGALALATTDLKEALDGVDIVMVALPATAHAEVAAGMASLVRDGQTVILNPGRTGGALEVRHVFDQKGVTADVTIAEAQTFLYTSRQIDPTSAHVFDVKNEVLVASLPSYRTPEVLKAVRAAYPQFIPGDNVLKTGLDNIGAIFHPGVMILNAGRVESTHGDFEYYLEGITPSVATILESMDRERVAVAEALGIHAHTAREWLYLVYHSPGRDLYQAIQATPGYKGITAPAHLNHRYILEDVPMSLVPIASLGEMLGVRVPTIRAVIHLASTIHGRDFWKEGRTVERLGLKGMSVRDIRLLVAGGTA